MKSFLSSEISSQELYDEIVHFVTSVHIRQGDFEGNEFVIKKIDSDNFIIFSEYELSSGVREIHAATAIFRLPLIDAVNEYAILQSIQIRSC